MKIFNVSQDYTLKIIDKGLYNEQQQDPTWYVSGYGAELVATLTHKDGYGANIYCVGEMRYEWGDYSLRHTSAILKETDYKTDQDLQQAIDSGEIVVENNPWFESVYFDENGEEWSDFNDTVAFELDEAIELARQLVEWTIQENKVAI